MLDELVADHRSDDATLPLVVGQLGFGPAVAAQIVPGGARQALGGEPEVAPPPAAQHAIRRHQRAQCEGVDLAEHAAHGLAIALTPAFAPHAGHVPVVIEHVLQLHGWIGD